MRRDISRYVSTHATTSQLAYDTVLNHNDLYGFTVDLEGNNTKFPTGEFGLYRTVGGDPGGVSIVYINYSVSPLISGWDL